jgi:hypothetical protein
VLSLAVGLPVLLALVPFVSEPSGGGIGNALGCVGYGAAFSTPLLALLVVLERRDRLPLVDIALCGASLGLAGAIVLDLHCTNTHPCHLLLGHASIGWIMILTGLMWARLQPPRRRR